MLTGLIILAVLEADVVVVLGRRKALASALVMAIALAVFLLLEIWNVNARHIRPRERDRWASGGRPKVWKMKLTASDADV